MDGAILRVHGAPEPSNVIWENLPVSRAAIFCRSLVTGFATVVLVAIGFGLTFVAMITKTFYAIPIPGFSEGLTDGSGCATISQIVTDTECLISYARVPPLSFHPAAAVDRVVVFVAV